MGNLVGRNKTLKCSKSEIQKFSRELLRVDKNQSIDNILKRLILGDFFTTVEYLPKNFVDLMIIDSPYNLRKDYNGNLFKKREKEDYEVYFRKIIDGIYPLMKSDATLYVCSDWSTSSIISHILYDGFNVRNRITWEREKGRGSKTNFKNNSEDIWYCTKSKNYYFTADKIKLKRKVIAPYRIKGKPKDWQEEKMGNFRLTFPSNIWTDVTVPFWSMPENTPHPTQKPEKLIAKLILSSSKKGGGSF